MDRKSRLKIVLLTVLAVLALAIISVVVAFFSLLSNSGEYVLPENSDSNEVSPYLTHYLAPEFWNTVQKDEPFEIVVSQDGLNDVISRDSIVDGGWPVEYNFIRVYAPQMKFETDQITILGKAVYNEMEVYLKALGSAKLTEEGLMKIGIDDIYAGKINVRNFVLATAKKQFQELHPDVNSLSYDAKIAYGIINDQPFEPVFQIADRKVKVSRLDLKDGKIVIEFTPVE